MKHFSVTMSVNRFVIIQ